MTTGRPTKYRPEFTEQAYKLCLLGATDPEMANFFEVCEATVHDWKNDFPDFLEAIRNGKIKADAHLPHKLYSRAEGAEWEDEQAIKVKTGQYTEAVEIVRLRRAAPPETTALIMWLTDRQKGLWRNTQSLQQLDKNGTPTDAPLRVRMMARVPRILLFKRGRFRITGGPVVLQASPYDIDFDISLRLFVWRQALKSIHDVVYGVVHRDLAAVRFALAPFVSREARW